MATQMNAQMENQLTEWIGGVFVHTEIYRNYLFAICQVKDRLAYTLGDPGDFTTYSMKLKMLDVSTVEEGIKILRAEVRNRYFQDIQNTEPQETDLLVQLKLLAHDGQNLMCRGLQTASLELPMGRPQKIKRLAHSSIALFRNVLRMTLMKCPT